MTDASKYTGSSKERFDESGKGTLDREQFAKLRGRVFGLERDQ